jgi:hypothetical protein
MYGKPAGKARLENAHPVEEIILKTVEEDLEWAGVLAMEGEGTPINLPCDSFSQCVLLDMSGYIYIIILEYS